MICVKFCSCENGRQRSCVSQGLSFSAATILSLHMGGHYKVSTLNVLLTLRNSVPLTFAAGSRQFYKVCKYRQHLNVSGFGVAVRRGSPFPSKIVVYGHCLVTAHTINKTLKWLTLLPTLMQSHSGGDNVASIGVRYKIPDPHPHPNFPFPNKPL